MDIIESKYLKRSRTKEGHTEKLRGASVEVAMVVNNVPIYELQLFTSDGKVAGFAKGFDVMELEHLSEVINDHISIRLYRIVDILPK